MLTTAVQRVRHLCICLQADHHLGQWPWVTLTFLRVHAGVWVSANNGADVAQVLVHSLYAHLASMDQYPCDQCFLHVANTMFDLQLEQCCATGCEPLKAEDGYDVPVCGIARRTKPFCDSLRQRYAGCLEEEPASVTEWTGDCADAVDSYVAALGCAGACLQQFRRQDARGISCAAAMTATECAAIAAPCSGTAEVAGANSPPPQDAICRATALLSGSSALMFIFSIATITMIAFSGV